ncbi:MAG TPA: riboflavin synthase [Candidatus Polarisedimenticolaceae bacterium]|nr:riboflavin synthase [Candidatus Polarisedimenticolaceae bacterium]
MFTGLIEGMGGVRAVAPAEGLTRLTLHPPFPAGELALGESVAVDGVCLTVTALTPQGFAVDAVAETLRCTTLGGLRPGDPVNLERALRVGDRLGGHLVQGHVDGTARVLEVSRAGGDVRIVMELPEALRPYVAFKGSIALSGVSLTVASLEDRAFGVALIPETLARTTLGGAAPGSLLNVEVDLLARYLEGLLQGRREGAA